MWGNSTLDSLILVLNFHRIAMKLEMSTHPSLSSAQLTTDGLRPPVGFTQDQLDQTILPIEGNRPDLEGVMDAVTGKQLVRRDAVPHEDKLRHAGLWDPEDDEEDAYEEDEEESEPPTAPCS